MGYKVGGVEFDIKAGWAKFPTQPIEKRISSLERLNRAAGGGTPTKGKTGPAIAADAEKKAVTRKTAALRAATAQQRQATAAQRQATRVTVRHMHSLHELAGAAGTVGAAFGAWIAGSVLRNATAYAGRVETLGIVLDQVGRNANYTRGELSTLETGVKALGISTCHARQSLVDLLRMQTDVRKAAMLSRVAGAGCGSHRWTKQQ